MSALSHRQLALIGFLLALPFFVANLIVVLSRFFAVGPWLVTLLVFLGLSGSFVAASPMFRKQTDGKRKFYLLNAVLAGALFLFFAWIGIVLGEEIYRCDILKIPNCD